MKITLHFGPINATLTLTRKVKRVRRKKEKRVERPAVATEHIAPSAPERAPVSSKTSRRQVKIPGLGDFAVITEPDDG